MQINVYTHTYMKYTAGVQLRQGFSRTDRAGAAGRECHG